MSDNGLTDAEHEQRKQAARSHGIYSFRDNGPGTLAPEKVGRLAELREMVKTQPGREQIRQETTARVALITELAYAEMRDAADDGESIFDAPVTARAGTWFAELRRLLDAWPPDELESANVLESLRNGD